MEAGEGALMSRIESQAKGRRAYARQRLGTDFRGRAPSVMLPDGHPEPQLENGTRELVMRIVMFGLAVVAGVLCGLYDLGSGRTMITALLVAVAAFVLAIVRPSSAWMTAILVALGVPAVYLWATIANRAIPYPPSPHIAATLLALLPAVGAALIGVFLHRLVIGEQGATPAR